MLFAGVAEPQDLGWELGFMFQKRDAHGRQLLLLTVREDRGGD